MVEDHAGHGDAAMGCGVVDVDAVDARESYWFLLPGEVCWVALVMMLDDGVSEGAGGGGGALSWVWLWIACECNAGLTASAGDA